MSKICSSRKLKSARNGKKGFQKFVNLLVVGKILKLTKMEKTFMLHCERKLLLNKHTSCCIGKSFGQSPLL